MAIYAIGDLQGCYDDLQRLLDTLQFDPSADQLWFVGDLVNRGPQSLETLRFVKSLGAAAITVLGNHDLHLIARAIIPDKTGKKDTLAAVLNAPDKDELIDWLRKCPLFHYNEDFCLLHAGLPPQWDFDETRRLALQAEKVIGGANYHWFFHSLYGNKPASWSSDLPPFEQLRFIVNSFTRMRYCDADGRMDFTHKGPPGSQPEHLMPWFKVPGRKSANMRIIFGHWSTLGYYDQDNCYGIDTGCLWGGQLTALKLGNPPQRISIDCAGEKRPVILQSGLAGC